MDFSPSELQRELAAGTRELLDAACPPGTVRAAWHKPAVACGVWAALAELGLPGALAPEGEGGLGLTVSDLLPALVETGRAAVPAPVVETALVALPLLRAAGRTDLVTGIAEGRTVLTAARTGDPVPWAGTGDDGPVTHVLLLDPAGPARLVAHEDARGEPVPAVDGSRPLARIDPAFGEPLDVPAGAVGTAVAAGALGTAAQLIGLAERQLRMTVDHVGERHQFGAPVGSFQAIKHHLADALLGIRFAEPAVRAAGLAMDGDPGAGAPGSAVPLAATLAIDAADAMSRTAIQCHGAIGYSYEYDLQLYAKRTWALTAAWGTADEHRRAYGDASGLPRR